MARSLHSNLLNRGTDDQNEKESMEELLPHERVQWARSKVSDAFKRCREDESLGVVIICENDRLELDVHSYIGFHVYRKPEESDYANRIRAVSNKERFDASDLPESVDRDNICYLE